MNPINISMPAAVVAGMLAAITGRDRADKIRMPSITPVRDTSEWRMSRAAAKRARKATKRSREWMGDASGWRATRKWIVQCLVVEQKPWSWNNPAPRHYEPRHKFGFQD